MNFTFIFPIKISNIFAYIMNFIPLSSANKTVVHITNLISK